MTPELALRNASTTKRRKRVGTIELRVFVCRFKPYLRKKTKQDT
jgi:hypothetical protein